jgi:hypothetical protein
MWRKRTERVTALNEEMDRIVSGGSAPAPSHKMISNQEFMQRHGHKIKQLPRG